MPQITVFTAIKKADSIMDINLVQRRFVAKAPNLIWVGDITYLWMPEGWPYLAVFIDLHSRMVVGWATGTPLTASLVTLALARAVARRRPADGLIVHTDQGTQYASTAFRQALKAARAKEHGQSRRLLRQRRSRKFLPFVQS